MNRIAIFNISHKGKIAKGKIDSGKLQEVILEVSEDGDNCSLSIKEKGFVSATIELSKYDMSVLAQNLYTFLQHIH